MLLRLTYTILIIFSPTILLFPFASEGHESNNNDNYYHPLLSGSYNNHRKGRARIWKYENDISSDKTETEKFIENQDGERVNPFSILPASAITNCQSLVTITNNHHQPNNLISEADDDSSDKNELQCTLHNQSPTQKYRPHPSFPTDHIRNKYRKTGTTIVGCLAQNTLILAADTRATEGSIVADKMCEKIHCLAKNVWACGAGTSGDIDALVKKVRYTFLLRGLIEECIGNDSSSSNSVEDFTINEEHNIGMSFPNASIAGICRFIQNELYSGGGEIGANLVLGGFDQSTNRAVLVAIHPHGSMDLVPYTALGSGGLAAMGVLESRFRTDMTVEEALELVKDAVNAGITNDLGSGSQIDISIIGASGVQYVRGIVKEEKLILSTKDKRVREELYRRHKSNGDKLTVMDGVNGFGSLPYWIKSRRLIMESEENIEQAKIGWLDNVLKGSD